MQKPQKTGLSERRHQTPTESPGPALQEYSGSHFPFPAIATHWQKCPETLNFSLPLFPSFATRYQPCAITLMAPLVVSNEADRQGLQEPEGDFARTALGGRREPLPACPARWHEVLALPLSICREAEANRARHLSRVIARCSQEGAERTSSAGGRRAGPFGGATSGEGHQAGGGSRQLRAGGTGVAPGSHVESSTSIRSTNPRTIRAARVQGVRRDPDQKGFRADGARCHTEDRKDRRTGNGASRSHSRLGCVRLGNFERASRNGPGSADQEGVEAPRAGASACNAALPAGPRRSRS